MGRGRRKRLLLVLKSAPAATDLDLISYLMSIPDARMWYPGRERGAGWAGGGSCHLRRPSLLAVQVFGRALAGGLHAGGGVPEARRSIKTCVCTSRVGAWMAGLQVIHDRAGRQRSTATTPAAGNEGVTRRKGCASAAAPHPCPRVIVLPSPPPGWFVWVTSAAAAFPRLRWHSVTVGHHVPLSFPGAHGLRQGLS